MYCLVIMYANCKWFNQRWLSSVNGAVRHLIATSTVDLVLVLSLSVC